MFRPLHVSFLSSEFQKEVGNDSDKRREKEWQKFALQFLKCTKRTK